MSWEILTAAAVAITVYMVIYALEWSWNYVVLAPMIVDSENQAKLKQQAGDLAALTEKVKAWNRQKEIRAAFAKLMDEGKILQIRMSESQDQSGFDALGKEMIAWVDATFNALVGAEMDTDAIAFRDSGHQPDPDQD